MNKETIEKLKKHIEENESIDILEDLDKLHEIKLDYEELSKLYLKYFNQFNEDFKEKFSKDQEISNLIKEHTKYVTQLIVLLRNIKNATNFGKPSYLNELDRFMEENYFKMLGFLKDARQIYKTKKEDKLLNALEKLEIINLEGEKDYV